MIVRWGADRLVLLPPHVTETILRFTGAEQAKAEAGGILIGCYRGPHLEITGCTGPMRRDIRKRTLFDRRDPGHQAAALTAWRQSGQTKTYVGEWHTHPKSDPTPSAIDLRTWTAILRRTPGPIMFMIAGSAETWLGVGDGAGVERARWAHD